VGLACDPTGESEPPGEAAPAAIAADITGGARVKCQQYALLPPAVVVVERSPQVRVDLA
jgi:hypothetical protein